MHPNSEPTRISSHTLKTGPRSRRKDALFAFVAVALFFVASEAALQILNRIQIAIGYTTDDANFDAWERGHAPGFYVQDPHLGWRLKPGRHEPEMVINSLGFRGPEIDPKKPRGVKRIFCTGDSAAFGFGVRTSDHYTALTQQMLDERGHCRVEVVNAGVGGYTTYQVRILVEEVILPLGPDAVTILSGVNDFCYASYLPDRFAYKSEAVFNLNMLLAHSEVYRRLKRILFPMYRRIYESSSAKEDGEDFNFRVSGPQMVENLQYIADLGKEHGFSVILFQYPSNMHNTEEPHVFKPYLDEAARLDNVTLVDIDALFKESLARGENPCQADGGHPNALGNRIMADALVSALGQMGLLED